MVDGGLGPHTPAVAVNDTLNGCESYTGPRKLRRGMESLKDAKQPVGKLHIKSDPVVAHKQDRLAINCCVAEFDFGPGVF